jgi:hypothetical protein
MNDTLEKLDDKELYDQLEKAGLAEKLESQPEWALIKEAANRIVDRAITEFALRTKPDDMKAIIMLQVIIKKYKFGVFDEIKVLKEASEMLSEEAKSRGIFGDFFANLNPSRRR